MSMRLERVTKRAVEVKRVPIAAPFAAAIEDSLALQVKHDLLDGALRDADADGDIAQSRRALRCQAEEDVRVIAQKRPPPGGTERGREGGRATGPAGGELRSDRHAMRISYEF